MKKSYLMLAAAAALFAACSNDDGVVEAQKAEQQVAAGEVPVGFSAYVNRSTTRAGLTGDVDAAAIKTAKVGFGVFAYHTNSDVYDQTFTPNFMYNQQVTYSTDKWVYTPIKYWPNEFGANAASEDVDKVSFFAYAPFVSVDAASGKVKDNHTATYTADNGDKTYGIVGMKSNSAAGDPMVKYMASFYTDQQVDLVWGTMNATNYGSGWAKKNGGDAQTVTAGKPWLNMEHPTATSTAWDAAQKIEFDFKHALARLNVTVDTKTNATTLAAPATDTKVFIRSVTFEGFDMKGALNLNNVEADKAQWYNFDCLSELNNGNEVTIKDGRTDGKEGVTAATKEFAAINKNFVQDGTWAAMNTAATARPGVTGTAANLFCPFGGGVPASDAPIYVIPNGDPLKVTIEYDVLTADANLNGKLNDGTTPGSVVKNVITRYITLESAKGSVTPTGAITLANGLKYTIALHLGLNSVEFDASVTGWPTAEADGADLPHNN